MVDNLYIQLMQLHTILVLKISFLHKTREIIITNNRHILLGVTSHFADK